MNKRAVAVVGGIVVVAVGWALFRPELLFIDKAVNEDFPMASAALASMPASGDAAMPGDSMLLRSGPFHGVAHATKGTASIHQLAGGRRVLRLTGFETSNGPDLRVLLVAAADAADNDAVRNGKPVELGKLKGNVGDQNYDVPADLDLNAYRAVTIWCNRFNVNFATAPLAMVAGGGPDTVMKEPMPSQPAALKSGTFHGVAHETRGTATIYQVGGSAGTRVLRLADFQTSNGPDVRVLLVAGNDAADNDAVRNGMPVELGKLKGNVGDQNYDVPAGIDLDRYAAVTIWCNRFGVNFGTAPLR
jgi:hypothetical protein